MKKIQDNLSLISILFTIILSAVNIGGGLGILKRIDVTIARADRADRRVTEDSSSIEKIKETIEMHCKDQQKALMDFSDRMNYRDMKLAAKFGIDFNR